METNHATIEPPASLPPPEVPAALDAVHACKILVIDDEEPNVRLLQRVLTGWLMPGFDGCAVIESNLPGWRRRGTPISGLWKICWS